MMLFRMPPSCRSRRRALRRWIVWGIAMAMLPAVAFGAYQPAFLAVANNLSDLASAATARTNLGLSGAATMALPVAVANGGTGTGTAGGTALDNVSAISCTGILQRTGAGAYSCTSAGSPSLTTFSGSLPATLSSTNQVTTISSMATPAAGVYNLPTASAGLRSCLKDGTTDFSANNATVKASGTIDGVAGATGIVMSQKGQELCFISDGTNWFIE